MLKNLQQSRCILAACLLHSSFSIKPLLAIENICGATFISDAIFSCPSSSIPTLVIHSFMHAFCKLRTLSRICKVPFVTCWYFCKWTGTILKGNYFWQEAIHFQPTLIKEGRITASQMCELALTRNCHSALTRSGRVGVLIHTKSNFCIWCAPLLPDHQWCIVSFFWLFSRLNS